MQPRVTPLNFQFTSPTSATPSRPRGRPGRAATAAVVLAVSLPMVLLLRHVWNEWTILMREEQAVAASAVIGYPNISPAISRAAPPRPYCRIEGDALLIWSGWKAGEGHGWFKLTSADCDTAMLSQPIGRDVARAIDYPDAEVAGGPIWDRIPGVADVAGLALGATTCAYPKVVLAKVLVVNDEIEGVPYLVHHDPFAAVGGRPDVAVYDPRIDGRRITLGSSGFTIGRKHVLYDRGTESLWVDQDAGMVAFGGKLKGRTLPLVKRVPTTSWRSWQEDHPSSRLLVGSLDRARGLPAE